MLFISIQHFSSQKYARNNEDQNFWPQGLQIAAFLAKFSPMLVEMPYFGGVINPKTYLNHELASKFFFLSDLAYKLVNLLVYEKKSGKMSKNWTFQKLLVWDCTSLMNLKSVISQCLWIKGLKVKIVNFVFY